jgi:hypothetical protein
MDPNEKHPNAKKWTEEIVSEHLLFIERDAETGRCFFLGRALAHRGLYRDVWKYWKKIFATNDNIMEQMLLIESLFEANLLESALKKELPARLARLTLCYNYGWVDREPKRRAGFPGFLW